MKRKQNRDRKYAENLEKTGQQQSQVGGTQGDGGFHSRNLGGVWERIPTVENAYGDS
ncbi:MAG: hypothetical protein HQM04_15030 [Magnetococcales bacterium]|nr:hypothetical protein [Magnetococcales bacterium]MBF0116339.1 hypothetical protein [Magnetococcales bacterium]